MSQNPQPLPEIEMQRKRTVFQLYLHLTGFTDTLIEIISEIFNLPQWPEDALKYLCDSLSRRDGIETPAQMNNRIYALEKEIDCLRQLLIEKTVNNWLRTSHKEEASTQTENPSIPGTSRGRAIVKTNKN